MATAKTPRATSAQPGAPTSSRRKTSASGPQSLLRELGIIGIDQLEPVILAAIATEQPLLLIGTHGTAKSLLLSRLCEGLGLSWRHYNASLLNYDDLVGYPLPDDAGNLKFVQTPASIWGAEAVFIDEISRCRPDMLNRLFPIIHERRIQGLPLTDLRFRWAAMNPPADPDAADSNYVGSEPLDPALADRFPFIITIPAFATLSTSDQKLVIQSSASMTVPPELSARLRETIATIRHRIDATDPGMCDQFSEYVRLFIAALRQKGVSLSGRRAAMLYRNLIAVSATSSPGTKTAFAATCWQAVSASLPQTATGSASVSPAQLLAIHREAWAVSLLDQSDPRKLLHAEPHPVRRALLALDLGTDIATRSAFVADALGSLPPGARHALAFHLASRETAQVSASVGEQIADLYAEVAIKQEVDQQISRSGQKFETSNRIDAFLARPPANAANDLGVLTNLLLSQWGAGSLRGPADVDAIVTSWVRQRQELGTPTNVSDDGRAK